MSCGVGTCFNCKANTRMLILRPEIREFYQTINPKHTNPTVKFCPKCYGDLSNIMYRNKGNLNSAINSTTVNSLSTIASNISTLQPSFSSLNSSSILTNNSSNITSRVPRNDTIISNPLDTTSSESLPIVGATNNSSNITNRVPISDTIISNPLFTSSESLPLIDLQPKKRTTTPPISIKRKRKNEVTARKKPGPKSKTLKTHISKNIDPDLPIEYISSDEDTVIFDTNTRLPNIQPIIKNKKRRQEIVTHFEDHDAPIFDTSHITGG